jgi:hypothetical protein
LRTARQARPTQSNRGARSARTRPAPRCCRAPKRRALTLRRSRSTQS